MSKWRFERSAEMEMLIESDANKAKYTRRALVAWETWRHRHQDGVRVLCRVCGRPQHAKELCLKHYNQRRRQEQAP